MRKEMLEKFFLAKPALILLLCTLSFATTAQAHVKWFVTSEGIYGGSSFQFDWLSILILSGFLFYLGTCYFLQKRAEASPRLATLLHSPLNFSIVKNCSWQALKFSIALLLVANIIQGHFIAPNFTFDPPSKTQMFLQAGLIIALIVNVNLFAVGLASFSLLMLLLFPFSSAIDYAIELWAIGMALYFMHSSRAKQLFVIAVGRYQFSGEGINIGLCILRVGLGLQLIVLTIHDKFMHPGLALHFLEHHPNFNFLQLFGFSDFANLHFVLAAGLAELAFGLLLVANVGIRIALIMVLFFFSLSGVLLGPEELIGHVPIAAIALILFIKPGAAFIRMSHRPAPHLATD